MNDDLPGGSVAETKIYLKEGASIVVNGFFSFHYGADVKLFKNAELILDGGYCNINCLIRCRKKIHIGEGVAIAHNVTIMDSDFHGSAGKEIDGEVNIKKNVWIGNGATILKGVTIGEGAIIGAGTVVTKDVPAHTLFCGCPGMVKKEKVTWK
ncbi:MAG: acyltransferase [Victivallaceae bacterium]|nr:acyltransferase [Victivallaceae bacterium]